MTVQVKDACRYLDGEYQMSVCLPFPVDGLRIEELNREEFAIEDTDGTFTSTACWRNYVAIWAIKEQRLLLIRLEGKYRIINGQPLEADWFTGEFALPQGELVDFNVELDFLPKYEKAVTLKFDSGLLVENVMREAD